MQTRYSHEEMHSVGIGPGSPNSWDEYSNISPDFKELLQTMYTPAAYKGLHYNSNTFKHLYTLTGLPFKHLEIFKLDGKKIVPLISELCRAPYRPIHLCAQITIRNNHRGALQNITARRTDDISPFVNMGFACESIVTYADEPGPREGPARLAHLHGNDPRFRRTMLKGFFPYLCNLSVALGEIMFFFTYAQTGRLALVTAPDYEREKAITFMREHGVMQLFDKVCAQCGKTGDDLYKCKCRGVRYCCIECSKAHWPMHKDTCEWRRAQRSAEADAE